MYLKFDIEVIRNRKDDFMKKRSVFLKLLSLLLVTTQLTGTAFADTGDKAKI